MITLRERLHLDCAPCDGQTSATLLNHDIPHTVGRARRWVVAVDGASARPTVGGPRDAADEISHRQSFARTSGTDDNPGVAAGVRRPLGAGCGLSLCASAFIGGKQAPAPVGLSPSAKDGRDDDLPDQI